MRRTQVLSLYSTASQNDKGLPRHRIDDERLRGIAAIVRFYWWIQPVNATRSLSISAGVWKPSVFRGLWFNCLAIALS